MIGVPLGAPISFAEAIGCPKRRPCEGCGCKGGTGYRGPDGRCVGFKQLDKVCGSPPEARCVFENAPGTGENRECALAKPPPKNTLPMPAQTEKSGQ